MAASDRVVAIGLLTEQDLALLGRQFHRLFRIPDDTAFQDLIFQIDAADARSAIVRLRDPSASD